MPSFQALCRGCCAGLLLVSVWPAQAQDLVGCQLLDGQLSCVPGVSGDPEAQIRALRGEIADTLSQENTIQQSIDGLESLELDGEASEGSLLRAVADADALAALPASAFHWYRLAPDATNWVWISGAEGPTYVLQAEDVGRQVMLVVAVEDGDAEADPMTASRRQTSNPVGPVQP